MHVLYIPNDCGSYEPAITTIPSKMFVYLSPRLCQPYGRKYFCCGNVDLDYSECDVRGVEFRQSRHMHIMSRYVESVTGFTQMQ
jgi:hypothetical protein